MSKRAWAYVLGVILAGVALSVLALSSLATLESEWMVFAVLVVLTTAAHLYMSIGPSHEAWAVNLVFLFAGLILLSPFGFVLLVVIPHLFEWAIERWIKKSASLRNWYIQPFNISVHLIAGFSAYRVFISLTPDAASLVTLGAFLAAMTAAVTYVLVNHLLIGLVLILARRVTWRESGVLDPGNLLSDLVQAALGYVVAVMWEINPILIVPTLAPLLLIFRALQVPKLTKEAHTDAKTGLWNTRHFNEIFNTELERAKRFQRPLAVIMADLDLLRNVNNTYGHLAGDAVLTRIGQIIRDSIRDYDLAARFGGEEFSIVLLEAEREGARAFANRLRHAIEQAEFAIPTSPTPIHVTMSLGVACYPSDGRAADELIQLADVAVYQAKLHGRNCVFCAADVPQSINLVTEMPADQTTTAYQAAYLPRSTSTPLTEQPPVGAASTPGQSQVAPPPTSQSASSSAAATPRPRDLKLTMIFVGSVLALAALAVGLGLMLDPNPINVLPLVLLVMLAVIAELLEVNVYGLSTVSVSVAVNYAAALIAGVPGLVLVSAAIVTVHYFKVRPALYQTALNWAAHVLAALVPFFVVNLNVADLNSANVIVVGTLIIMTSLGYFFIETGLVATAIALSEQVSISVTWSTQFRWLLSHYLVLCGMGAFLAIAYVVLGPAGLIIFALPPFMMHYVQKQYVERTEDSVRELQRLNTELTRANQEVVTASRAIQDLNNELFLILAKIVDIRDPYVSSHTIRVAEYAVAVATELGLPLARLETIRQAALLHDIGKIGIPEDILHKPTRLTDEEYQMVQRHAVLGAELLETCQGLRQLVSAVKYHHEWWDGTGYPDQFKGEDIPLEARILAVCDAVEAMASDRPYSRARTLDQIIAELQQCAGTQFDPTIVDVFVKVARRRGNDFVVNSARDIEQRQAYSYARAANQADAMSRPVSTAPATGTT